jgi:superfamily II DNA/RNA helicase
VYSITGETEKKERAEILQKFKQEPDAIICNVGVLTAGFDEPTIETIILNRATKSLSLYLQMIGRGSRLSENKSNFTVIDLGKNTARHGQYTDFFDWQTYFKNGTKKENNDFIDQIGDLIIDREKYIVYNKAEEIILARKEFELLALLASKPGKVFLRNEILSKVWGTEVIVGDRTIDVHIRKIRQKLNLDCISTVKGVGYKFEL